MEDLAGAQEDLASKEDALLAVKAQYDAAVGEKQRLTDAANVCLRKMTAATHLINGLGGEKIRWTQQSKDFKKQLGRFVFAIRMCNFKLLSYTYIDCVFCNFVSGLYCL